MTIVQADDEGLRQVGRTLDAGIPTVVPLPTPLPYVVAGSDAAAVNLAKFYMDPQSPFHDTTKAAGYLEFAASTGRVRGVTETATVSA